MATSDKLDRIIDGTRYRSTTKLAPRPGRSQYVHGVRDVALWICRRVIVLETDSQWDDGSGACRGACYSVLDPRDADARMMIQRFADNWSGYCDGDADPEEILRAWANRHAPAEGGLVMGGAR